MLGGQLAATHAALLNAYNPEARPWHAIADSYLYSHLVSHLLAAGRSRDLEALFSDDGWMHGRYEAAGYVWSGVIEDLKVVWHETAQKEALREIAAGEAPGALAHCFRYALIRATINSLAINYPEKLVARAVELGEWTLQRAISLASQSPAPAHRADMFAAIARTGKLDDLELVKVVRLGLNAAFSNYYAALSNNNSHVFDGMRVVVDLLNALDAPHRAVMASKWPALLSPNLWDRDSREEIVSWLVDNLSGEQRARFVETELLQELSRLKSDRQSDIIYPGVVEALVPVLTEVQIKLALEVLLHCSFCVVVVGSATNALGRLMSRLNKEQLEQVLKVVESQTANPAGQAHLFAAIAASLGEPQRTRLLVRALKLAKSHNDEFFSSKTYAFAKVVPFLTEELLPPALDMALRMKSDSDKAIALQALGGRLSGTLLKRATQAALRIKDLVSRCEALTALSGQWDVTNQERVAEEALGIAQGLAGDELYKVLDRLAPLVPAKRVPQILAMAKAFRREGMFSALMTKLAPRLGRPELQAALAEAGTIGGERQYVSALVALSRYLKGAHLPHALDVALRIRYDGHRSEALADLLPHLRGQEVAHAAEVAVESALAAIPNHNVIYRSHTDSIHPEPLKALERIAPYLTETQLSRVLDWIRALPEWPDQAHALCAIAPCLSGEMLQISMEIVHGFQMPWAWDGVLARLAPRLTGALREKAIENVLDIARTHGGQGFTGIGLDGEALAAYAPDLTEEQLHSALEDMSHDLGRAHPGPLATLAARTPRGIQETLVQHALRRFLYWCQTYSVDAEALTTLMPMLTVEQRAECFEQIMKKTRRAFTL